MKKWALSIMALLLPIICLGQGGGYDLSPTAGWVTGYVAAAVAGGGATNTLSQVLTAGNDALGISITNTPAIFVDNLYGNGGADITFGDNIDLSGNTLLVNGGLIDNPAFSGAINFNNLDVDKAGAFWSLAGSGIKLDVGVGELSGAKWKTALDATDATEIVNYQTMTNYVIAVADEMTNIVSFPNGITVAGTLIDGSTSAISVASVSFDGHFIPTESNQFDIGSSLKPIRSLYVGEQTIYLGGTALSTSNGTLVVTDGTNAPVDAVLVGDNVSDLTNDAGYLTSYNETDPIWSGVSNLYALVSSVPTNNNQLINGAGYLTSFTESDPIWSGVSNLYYLASNPSGYLTGASPTLTTPTITGPVSMTGDFDWGGEITLDAQGDSTFVISSITAIGLSAPVITASANAVSGTQVVNYQTMTNKIESYGYGTGDAVLANYNAFSQSNSMPVLYLAGKISIGTTDGIVVNIAEDVPVANFLTRELESTSSGAPSVSLDWGDGILSDTPTAFGMWQAEGTATGGIEIVNYQTMTNWVISNPGTPPAINTTTTTFTQNLTLDDADGELMFTALGQIGFDSGEIYIDYDGSSVFQMYDTVGGVAMVFTNFASYTFDDVVLVGDASSGKQAVNYQTMENNKAWGIVGITNTYTATTPSTFTQVTNWLTTGISDQVTLTKTGLIATVAGKYDVSAVVSASGGVSATHKYQIQKNGTAVLFGTQTRKLGTGGDIGDAAIGAQVTLAVGDRINLAVQADGGNVVMPQAHIRMHRLGE